MLCEALLRPTSASLLPSLPKSLSESLPVDLGLASVRLSPLLLSSLVPRLLFVDLGLASVRLPSPL